MKIKSSNKSYDNMEVNNYKDCFHAFMVEGAVFDGYYDIPFIPQNSSFEINNLIPYVETLNHTYKNGDVVHFYLDDYKFDGPKGIWNGITSRINSKRSFDLSRFNGVSAIISPDFSLYLDMPKAMQVWNVYRSRTVGYYLSKIGFNVIPNVRWTDDESYSFAFDGIYEGQIVAVGTLGCSKSNKDKALFVNGFIEMVKRIKPSLVIIYGVVFKELTEVIDYYKVKVKQFDSKVSLFYRGITNGNEK